ncbi:MAG: hypothetical protein JXQ68_06715 [Campylobacterales bacterium]|nr:hypothetical protein [Campylobacterales bacterium]
MKIFKEFNLVGTNSGKIGVGLIEEPYGPGSLNVATIGVSLAGNIDEPDWKVHIPKENIDSIIEALQEVKKEL